MKTSRLKFVVVAQRSAPYNLSCVRIHRTQFAPGRSRAWILILIEESRISAFVAVSRRRPGLGRHHLACTSKIARVHKHVTQTRVERNAAPVSASHCSWHDSVGLVLQGV